MVESNKSRERFEAWFRTETLPLWFAHGYDNHHGGFFEALNFDGSPANDLPRRVRVQSRQIYVTSRIAELGWSEEARTLSDKGFQYLIERACPDDGLRGCVHLLSQTGSVIDEKRDLYDQAFLLLACAWRWRVAQDDRALRLAEKTIAFIDQELPSPHGGWLENDRAETPRRQNPHMHLFEAYMALFDATSDDAFLLGADKIFNLFEEKFFDRDKDVLREFFNYDLTPAPGVTGQRIEPGHMVEWVWLLDEYAQRRNVDVTDYCNRLFRSARDVGTDPNSVFLVDGLVLGESPDGTRRLWPQTEYLKAASVFAKRGDKEAEKIIEKVIAACFETYLNQSVSGLWCDQFDAQGAPSVENVPASILYHLLDAVLAVQPERNPDN